VEADLFPLNHPERADLIDGTIGELSPFHSTYGYYAQGASETTARLPAGWRDRLIVIQNANTRGAKGLCLEIHDLVVSKTIAGREKDLAFLAEVARQGLADKTTLIARLDRVHAEAAVKAAAGAAIQRAYETLQRGE
jgi:hypothetical protein